MSNEALNGQQFRRGTIKMQALDKKGAMLSPTPDVNLPDTHTTYSARAAILHAAENTHAHRYDEHADSYTRVPVHTWRIHSIDSGSHEDYTPKQAKSAATRFKKTSP